MPDIALLATSPDGIDPARGGEQDDRQEPKIFARKARV